MKRDFWEVDKVYVCVRLEEHRIALNGGRKRYKKVLFDWIRSSEKSRIAATTTKNKDTSNKNENQHSRSLQQIFQ